MSYNRDSGAPAYGSANTNIRVDFAFGNMPMQPNEDRDNGNQSGLSVMDSHDISATEWNSYPELNIPTPGSRNYMITGFEFLGDVLYECTSQNNLKAGEEVTIRNIDWYEGPVTRTVTYADANRFQFLDEAGYPPKLTGLSGRADVVDQSGQTLEGGGVFYWPALGWCNGVDGEQAKVEHFFTYLRELGVNPAHLKDFTFSGGDNEWDASEDQPNWDGCVFYSYVPAELYMGQDDQGVPVYGSDVDGQIIYGSWNTGQEVDIATPNPEDFAVIVFSNDPRKDNAGWWGF